ncbi:hypothetical protein BMS3Bbin12_02207 [bacterium BMS3Bbin12]|nr:hypothetical protein BMS3Bbin12_02207 [bacterium BMS3Bbin12]
MQSFLRQFYTITFDTGEADLQRVPFRAHGLDLDGFPRRLRRHHDGLGGEVEGDAEHVGIFDIEQAFLVEVVGLTTQSAADDLFAQELGTEGAHTEHVGHGAGIPAFGEHGDGDHATDRFTQRPHLADRVHDLAQQSGVVNALAGAKLVGQIASTLQRLVFEAFDLILGHGAKAGVQGLAGFQLFAVDQQRIGAWQRIVVRVEIAEQLKPTVDDIGRTILVFPNEAGEVIVDQFRGAGVVADYNKARRHLDAGALP